MRELKFIVWDKILKTWSKNTHTFNHSPNGDLKQILLSPNSGDRYIFLQFAGSKDATGRDIFEGHLLKCDQWARHIIAEVKWNDENMRLAMKGNDPSQFYWEDFSSWLCSKDVLGNFNIIGHIYENPELL